MFDNWRKPSVKKDVPLCSTILFAQKSLDACVSLLDESDNDRHLDWLRNVTSAREAKRPEKRCFSW